MVAYGYFQAITFRCRKWCDAGDPEDTGAQGAAYNYHKQIKCATI